MLVVPKYINSTEKCHIGLLFEFTQRNMTYSRTTTHSQSANLFIIQCTHLILYYVVRKIKYQFQIGTFDLMFYWRFEYQWMIKLYIYEFKSFVPQFKETKSKEKKKKINDLPMYVFWLISLNNNTFCLFCMQKLQLEYRKWCVQLILHRRLAQHTKFIDHFENVSTLLLVAHCLLWNEEKKYYENATNIYVTHFKSLYHNSFHTKCLNEINKRQLFQWKFR